MATLVQRPNGRKSIQFTGGSGKRQELRLGKVPVKQAEGVLSKVEAILSDLALSRPHDAELAAWIKALPPKLMDRLQRLGLVPSGVNRQSSSLGEFLEGFFKTIRVKPSTATMYDHTRQNLLSHFGTSRQLRSIGVEEAEKFRLHLAESEKRRGTGKLSESTINRRVRIARSLFAHALKWRLVDENPFTSVKAGDQVNKARQFFVTRDAIEKVITACPNAEWRLIVSLARFGGLRCPSEILLLKWEDVDWERKRILVHSPKTEHHEGKDCRTIPMFPELEGPLLEAFGQATEGVPWVITRYRSKACNLRTQLNKIIKRAGLLPWPKLWQNMRATRQTELAEAYPIQVVCTWIGNSQKIAQNHYLQTTDAHFAKAVENPPQIPPQQAAVMGANGGKPTESTKTIPLVSAVGFSWLSTYAFDLPGQLLPTHGPEWSRTIDLVVISDAL